MYPGAVLYGLFFNIALVLDSIIAGHALGADGITAIALGMPGYGAIAAIIYSLIHGSGLRMIWAKGHADNEGYRRAFNGGGTLVGLVGFVFAVLIFAFAGDIVLFCGGDMVEPDIRHSATVYLSFCAPNVFLTALGMLLQEVLNVYGFQRARAALGVVNTAVNLIVSVLCTSFFPADMKLAALGIGTSAGGLAQFIVGLVLLRILKVPVGYRPLCLHPGEIIDTIRCGLPATTDFFSENIVMGIQNNLILSGFPQDALILPTTEIVCNISYFASGVIKGAAIATEPLFGVFYSERDVNSIRKVWKHGWTMGIFASVFWAVLFYLALPVLSSLCGMELSGDISRGVLLCLIFAPVMHTVYMFTLYYEAIKRFALSMAFAIVPDSCLYILMMALMIPVFKKDGIWLAITGNQLLGLILLIPFVMFIGKKSGKKMDRLLLLPEEFFTKSLITEFDIPDTGSDAYTELEKLRTPLKGILSHTHQIDTVLGFVKDLVSAMRQSSEQIHIKLRGNKEKTELFVRSLGNRWELPSSISENVRLCGGGASITCSYVYKMNIVCVTLAHSESSTPMMR